MKSALAFGVPFAILAAIYILWMTRNDHQVKPSPAGESDSMSGYGGGNDP